MPNSADATLRLVLRTAARGVTVTDRDLLARFAGGDQTAFAALVGRHAGLVLGVCQRSLRSVQDAEDACQATFLILARKASSARWQPSVANWLFATARRVARNARRGAARRAKHEARATVTDAAGSLDRVSGRELLAILDEELARLPPHYREPLVLCYLQELTREEAAIRLGLPAATLKTRLDRGRRKLGDALAKRGVASVVVLAAAASSAARAVPPRLIDAAMAVAAGHVSPVVAALANGVAVNGVLPKSLLVAALVGVAALGTGAGVLRSPAGQPPEKAMPAKAAKAVADAAPPKPPAAAESFAYSGTVVDTTGQPVPQADVYYCFKVRESEPCPVRATTGADGKFEFTLTPGDVPASAHVVGNDPFAIGSIVVKAEGYTFAWGGSGPGRSWTYRTEKDVTPLTGRVIDLQGRPLVGLRVAAVGASAPRSDLSPFVRSLREGQSMFESILHVQTHLANRRYWPNRVPILPSTTTDADGRFRLLGFARERLVEIQIAGGEVETQTVYVMNRRRGPADGPSNVLRPKMYPDGRGEEGTETVLFDGADLVAAPGQTVAGSVRDAASGRPISGAIVETYRLARTNLGQNALYSTTADADGRYRLAGLPRGEDTLIRFRGGPDRPHVPVVKEVPAPKLFEPARLDVALEPGVWVDVSAADAATGRPVAGLVSYMVYPDPPQNRGTAHPLYRYAYDQYATTRADGSYRFAAVPGKAAVLAFRADWAKYPVAADAPARTLPSHLTATNYQAFADLNPRPGDEPVRVPFKLNAGRSAEGRVVDPDGQPLTGALVAGLRSDWYTWPEGPQKSDRFTAIGLDPARPRRIGVAHAGRKLAGTAVVRCDESAPVVVTLQPWGSVTGRLLGAGGQPLERAALTFMDLPRRKPGTPRAHDAGLELERPTLGADGRFTAAGLIPGLRYSLVAFQEATSDEELIGVVFRDLVVRPGEAKDLGDVTVQLLPKD